jgi:hypothetical protein
MKKLGSLCSPLLSYILKMIPYYCIGRLRPYENSLVCLWKGSNGNKWAMGTHVQCRIKSVVPDQSFRNLYKVNHCGPVATELSGGRVDNWITFEYEDTKWNDFVKMLVADTTILVSDVPLNIINTRS